MSTHAQSAHGRKNPSINNSNMIQTTPNIQNTTQINQQAEGNIYLQPSNAQGTSGQLGINKKTPIIQQAHNQQQSAKPEFNINQIKIPANIPLLPTTGHHQNISPYNYQPVQTPYMVQQQYHVQDGRAQQYEPGPSAPLSAHNKAFLQASNAQYGQVLSQYQHSPQNYNVNHHVPHATQQYQQNVQRHQHVQNNQQYNQQTQQNTQQQPQPYIPQIIKIPAKNLEYRVCEKLGKGGFAHVYKGVNTKTGEEVAIKIVSKAQCQKSKIRDKLMLEIKIHKQLQHPYICQLKDSSSDDNNFYIILELCQFNSLNNLLKERGPLGVDEIQYFTYQLLLALSYLKQHKIIHRDIKSQNVILKAEPGGSNQLGMRQLTLKLADFGLSAQLQSSADLRCTFCGTPNFLAPETLISHVMKKLEQNSQTIEQNIDSETIKMVQSILERLPWLRDGHGLQSDMWSMGCLIYQMATGKPPYETDKISTTYKRIIKNEVQKLVETNIKDACMRELISNLLITDPNKRWTVEQALQSQFMSFIKLRAIHDSYIGARKGNQKNLNTQNQFLYNSQIKVMFPELQQDNIQKLSVKEILAKQNEIQLQQSQYKQMLNKLFVHYMIRDSSVKLDKLKPVISVNQLLNLAVRQNVRDMTIQEVIANNLENEINQYNLFIAKVAAHQDEISCQQQHNQQNPGSTLKQSVNFYVKKQKHIYVSKWLEKQKYGLAYMLNNRCYGVAFNDSTYLIQSPNGIFFDYYDKSSETTIRFRSAHLATFVGTKKENIFHYFKENLARRDVGAGENFADTFDIFLDQFLEALYEYQVTSKYATEQRFDLPGFQRQCFQQKNQIDSGDFLNRCRDTLAVIQGQGVYMQSQAGGKVYVQFPDRLQSGNQEIQDKNAAVTLQHYQYKHVSPYNIQCRIEGHKPEIRKRNFYEINTELLKKAIGKYIQKLLSSHQQVSFQLQKEGYFSYQEITNDLYEQLLLVCQYPMQYVYEGSVEDDDIKWFKLSQNVQQFNLGTHEKLVYYDQHNELGFFNAQRHGVVAGLKQFRTLGLKDFADIETSVQDHSLRPII